jgi:hypothetical protein
MPPDAIADDHIFTKKLHNTRGIDLSHVVVAPSRVTRFGKKTRRRSAARKSVEGP